MEIALSPMEFARRARRLYADKEAVVDGEYSRAIEGVIGVVSRVIGGDGGKGAATGGDDGAGSRRAANPGVVSRDIGGDAVCEGGGCGN